MHRKRLKRFDSVYDAHFLTFSCDGRNEFLIDGQVRDRFVDRLIIARRALPIEIYAWVIMTNHVHLLLRCRDSGLTVSDVLERIKSRFATQELKRMRGFGTAVDRFWLPGGGYDRNIHSKEELGEKRNYIEQNPVRAGFVLRPEEWKWSSAGWPEKFWDEA
jgi:putative transposase